jgi:hypothetical protein
LYSIDVTAFAFEFLSIRPKEGDTVRCYKLSLWRFDSGLPMAATCKHPMVFRDHFDMLPGAIDMHGRRHDVTHPQAADIPYGISGFEFALVRA